ncbi:MAG: TIGR04255 family protein [Dechloromonas sp.]|nr:MAG: TIGR04255 family protein [Dechloromonas sp.]
MTQMATARPVNDKHAVTAVLFGVEFAKNVEGDLLRQIEVIKPEFEDTLPIYGLQQNVSVQGKPSPDGKFEIVSQGATEYAGFVMHSLKPDGRIDHQLSVEAKLIKYVAFRYSSWTDIWPFVERLLSACITAINGQWPIKSFTLEYNDRFTWEEGVDYDAAHVFRERTEFVAPKALASKTAWHSNNAFFEMHPFRDTGDEWARLVTVRSNVARIMISNKMRWAATIKTNLRDSFNPGLINWQDPAESIALLSERFPLLHEKSKEVLASIINDAQMANINLYGGQDA